MKSITIRIEEKTAKKYAEVYGNSSRGAQVSAEGFINIRERIIYTLRGIFTEDELTALVQVFNGTIRQESIMIKSFLLANVEDAEKFESFSVLYSFDFPSLMEKLGKLSDEQAYFLMDLIFVFWDTGKGDLQGFLDHYSKKEK